MHRKHKMESVKHPPERKPRSFVQMVVRQILLPPAAAFKLASLPYPPICLLGAPKPPEEILLHFRSTKKILNCTHSLVYSLFAVTNIFIGARGHRILMPPASGFFFQLLWMFFFLKKNNLYMHHRTDFIYLFLVNIFICCVSTRSKLKVVQITKHYKITGGKSHSILLKE